MLETFLKGVVTGIVGLGVLSWLASTLEKKEESEEE